MVMHHVIDGGRGEGGVGAVGNWIRILGLQQCPVVTVDRAWPGWRVDSVGYDELVDGARECAPEAACIGVREEKTGRSRRGMREGQTVLTHRAQVECGISGSKSHGFVSCRDGE